ncbi:putative multidrug resistance ABC transporter ATP-binding/permease protein YheI [Ruminiclostridium hungatei]|uniref:Putative multidrug resistance ABC transporter ATP-binding/permease protein YheI n=2 Tax=Ruminiclostridium hungatei TaxID=48256 RepID=A0A1V4SNA2_RUMHU|nr:putative multidrug resistance ABC transporter ATP-binding/permease protein YheI [Ruminiclostridium hungatei]
MYTADKGNNKAMDKLRHIRDLLSRNKFRYAIGIVFLLCVDILQLVLPKILGNVTDLLENHTLTKEKLAEYAVIITLIAVGVAALRFLFRYTLMSVSRSIELSLRNRFYAHLQKLSSNYFNTHKTGDLMAHATNDMGNVTMASGQGVIFVIDSFLIPIVALIMMLFTGGWKLTLACFLPLLLLGIAVVFFMKIMQSSVQKQQEAFSNLTEAARENFSGIRVIKAFAQEKKEIERFERINAVNREANLKYVRLMSMMFPTVMSISALSFVIALWLGGILVIQGSVTLGGFVAFNSYLGMLIWPITAIGWVANMFQRGLVSLERINTILDETPEIYDEDTADTAGINGTLEFKNLTFTYPGTDKPVLKDISLKLQAGRTLGIIGRTGSGKTTLVNLIPRLLKSPPGTLFIDGTDIEKIPLHVLRSRIGSVPQDTFLFSDTISENIDFFRENSSRDIEAAANTARILDSINEFPGKFSTVLGERGVTLSGGQKQRVAIARAIIGSPDILLLDDCLSAVDAHTEEEILRDLKSIMRQRTSVIVSHRISAVKDADEIIVLEDGSISQRGTHEELLSQTGFYRELYNKQLLINQLEEY